MSAAAGAIIFAALEESPLTISENAHGKSALAFVVGFAVVMLLMFL